MTDAATRIERAETALDHYGYIVASTPIDGMENEFADALWAGVRKIEYFLGRKSSVKAMEILHDCIPEPCWGVEVRRF